MQFNMVRIVESDNQEVLEFLRRNFFPNEPCAKALNLCPLGYQIPSLEADICSILSKGLSLAAYEPDSRQIVGVAILDVKHKDDDGTIDEKQYPEILKKLLHFFEDLSSDYGSLDIFQQLKVDSLLDIYIVCTSPHVSGQGLGSALMVESMTVGAREGIKAAQCMALSAYTQKICQRMEFQSLSMITYKDYSQNGDSLFKNLDMGEHSQGVFYVKKIM